MILFFTPFGRQYNTSFAWLQLNQNEDEKKKWVKIVRKQTLAVPLCSISFRNAANDRRYSIRTYFFILSPQIEPIKSSTLDFDFLDSLLQNLKSRIQTDGNPNMQRETIVWNVISRNWHVSLIVEYVFHVNEIAGRLMAPQAFSRKDTIGRRLSNAL